MIALVYEPFVHFIPTGFGWLNGLKELGHTTYQLPAFQYKITDVDIKVDLLIVHDVNESISMDIIKYKDQYPKTKIAVLTSTYEPHYDLIKDHVNLWFNLSIKNSYLEKEFKSRGMNFSSIQLAAHPQYSFPTNVKRIFDVSFFGQIGSQGHGYRNEDQYLYPVIQREYKGAFGGFLSFPPVHYSKLNDYYNETKINLNFHYNNQKIESPSDPLSRIELNGRTFEIALSGNFQICDHPAVESYFDGNIPYVSPEKWIETIDYYLTNDKKRNIMAEKSREIALEKHTYKARVKELLEKI